MQKKTPTIIINTCKNFISSILIILAYTNASAQDVNLPSVILKSQNRFYNENIPKNKQINYSYLIKYSKKLTNHIINDVLRRDSCLKRTDSINLIEGYNGNSSSFVAWIWKTTDRVYRYDYPVLNGNIFKTFSFEELGSDDKKIVGNFGDWENDVYKNITSNMYTANDGTYYLGTKIGIDKKKEAKTFAFYY